MILVKDNRNFYGIVVFNICYCVYWGELFEDYKIGCLYYVKI